MKFKAAVYLLLAVTCLLPPVASAQGTKTGNLTAESTDCSITGSCVSMKLFNGAGAVGLSVTGTFSQTIQFEGSADNGVSYVAISGFPPNSTTGASNTTSAGTWRFAVSGLTNLRVRCSSFSSGSAVIAIQQSPTAASLNQGGGGGGGSGTVTDFSAGNLSPLFTTSVATSSSTPALTFALSTFAAHKFYGNATGSTGAPSASSIGTGDLPAVTVFNNQANTYTGGGLQDFNAMKLKPPITVVGSLPTASSNTNVVYVVTDGASATDCATGSGSTRVWCVSTGSAWVALAGSGGGSGTVTSIATTSPITGGTITSTGTIACATCATASGLTTNRIPKIGTSPALGDSLISDDGTTMSYSGTGGGSFAGSVASGVGSGLAGAYDFVGAASDGTITTGAAGWSGPTSAVSTPYRLRMPTAEPSAAGLLGTAAASSHFAQTSFYTLSGSGTVVCLATSCVMTTPNLGTPSAVVLTNATGLPAASVLAGALANGMTATTQSAASNDTKVATDAYVDGAVSTAQGAYNVTTTGMTAGHAYYVSAANTLTEAGGALSATIAAVCVATSTTNCARVGTFTTTSLTAGAIYYVPTSSGLVTATKPTSSGQFVQRVGVALSTTVLLIQPSLDVGTVQ
jgi:hypothetical protein